MSEPDPVPDAPLRVFCLEDNPLIVFHLEQMIEDLGHVFAGSVESLGDLKTQFDEIALDAALVDIDLADGPTGPAAAAWLLARGIPSIFVTGQARVAAQHAKLVVGVVAKPISLADLAKTLGAVRSPRRAAG